VLELWEKHKEATSEDYRSNNQSSFAVEQMVLIDIRKLLESMQKNIKMYPLLDIDDTYMIRLAIILGRFLRWLALTQALMIWHYQRP
jgi:hypothetical protein